MTKHEWAEVVAWLKDRYDDVDWTKERMRVYYEDLQYLDAADVWQAVHRYHEKGSRWTPKPSELLAQAKAVYVQRIRTERQPARAALPARDAVTWAEHCEAYYGRILSFSEAIAEAHSLMPEKDCAAFKGAFWCPDHNPKGRRVPQGAI